MTEGQTTPEIAFYYPNPVRRYGDWVKNLVLFFDGVGLLVPEYMKERPEEADPAIVAGLKQHGLLHIIEPERIVDRGATEKLAAAMTDVITSGRGPLDEHRPPGSDGRRLERRERLAYAFLWLATTSSGT